MQEKIIMVIVVKKLFTINSYDHISEFVSTNFVVHQWLKNKLLMIKSVQMEKILKHFTLN